MRRAHLISSVCVVMLLVSAVILAEQQFLGALVAPEQILIQYERSMGVAQFNALCSKLSEQGFGFIRLYPRSRLLKVYAPYGDDSQSATAKAVARIIHKRLKAGF